MSNPYGPFNWKYFLMPTEQVQNKREVNSSSSSTEYLDTMSRIKLALETSGSDQWVLITPNGLVWKGNQQEIFRVLLMNADITKLLDLPFEGEKED